MLQTDPTRVSPLTPVVTFTLILLAGSTAELPRQAPATTCVDSWSEVTRGQRGYDHFVVLQSRCKTPARCEVSSNSNPKPLRVVVTPRKELRVLIFRGSPEPRFVPKVTCLVPPSERPLRPSR